MENNIASILFARGIMPDDFISYSTYGAVAEIVREKESLLEQLKQLKEENRELVEKMTELLKSFNDSDKNYADWVATKELYMAFTGVNNMLERLNSKGV